MLDPKAPPPPGAFDYLLDPPAKGRTLMPAPVPPAPPRQGGNGPNVRVQIEIVDRLPRRRRFPLILWFIIIVLLCALLACGAQAACRTYDVTWQRYIDCDDGWRGSSYQTGSTRYDTIIGPNGERKECRSYKQGWQIITECSPP